MEAVSIAAEGVQMWLDWLDEVLQLLYVSAAQVLAYIKRRMFLEANTDASLLKESYIVNKPTAFEDATVNHWMHEGQVPEEKKAEAFDPPDLAALHSKLSAAVSARQQGPRARPYTVLNGTGNVRATITGEQLASEKPFKEREDFEYATAKYHWEPYRPLVGAAREITRPVPEMLDSVADEPPGWYSDFLAECQGLAPAYTRDKAEALIKGYVTEADYFTEDEAHAALMREHQLHPMCKERYAAVKEILKGCCAVARYHDNPVDEKALKLRHFDSERDYKMRSRLRRYLFEDPD